MCCITFPAMYPCAGHRTFLLSANFTLITSLSAEHNSICQFHLVNSPIVTQPITFPPSTSRSSCPLIRPSRLRLSDHRTVHICTSRSSHLAQETPLSLCCSCRVQRYRFVYYCWFIGGYWCHWSEYFAICGFYCFCRAQFDDCVCNFWFVGGSWYI